MPKVSSTYRKTLKWWSILIKQEIEYRFPKSLHRTEKQTDGVRVRKIPILRLSGSGS